MSKVAKAWFRLQLHDGGKRRIRMTGKLIYLLGITAAIGCASTGANPTVARQSAAVLTAEEINQAHAENSNAYDAIARLRPNWLTPKGPTSGYYNAGTQ